MTLPVLSRRALLIASGAALTLPMRLSARGALERLSGCVVIDGLGGPGSLTAEPGQPLTDAHLKDVRDSGLSAVLLTVGTVGTMTQDEAFKRQRSAACSTWIARSRAIPQYFCQCAQGGGYRGGKEPSALV